MSAYPSCNPEPERFPKCGGDCCSCIEIETELSLGGWRAHAIDPYDGLPDGISVHYTGPFKTEREAYSATRAALRRY